MKKEILHPMEKLSPSMKLAELISYLNTDWKLSKRQLGRLAGYQHWADVIGRIIEVKNMDKKTYNHIFAELGNNVDVLQSLLMEAGRKS
jgi:hypothetical protein